MHAKNTIEKSFGPIGSFMGITIFLIGLITIFFSFIGFVLVLFGAFIGFSASVTTIDKQEKKVRYGNNLFGIIKTGKWIFIKPEMKIGIKRSEKVWRTYSRSNRSIDMNEQDYRIILYSASSKPILPIKKVNSLSNAKIELENLASLFGIGSV